MSNMGKGAGYYLTRSKSLLIDTAIVAILAIFMSFAMQMDALQSKGEDYLVLMLYAVIWSYLPAIRCYDCRFDSKG